MVSNTDYYFHIISDRWLQSWYKNQVQEKLNADLIDSKEQVSF